MHKLGREIIKQERQRAIVNAACEKIMKTYTVLVRYRTRSGVNASTTMVEALDMATAMTVASARVSHQRGVIRVDGAETIEPDQWPTYRPSSLKTERT